MLYHQAAEFAHILRIVVEKCAEWKLPLLVFASDSWKAFDEVKVSAVFKLFDHWEVESRLGQAILQEMADLENPRYFIPVWDGGMGDDVPMLRGLRQGSPEASLIFSAIIAMELKVLRDEWQRMGYGINFGAFGGSRAVFEQWHRENFKHIWHTDVENLHLSINAFVEDMLIFASGERQANIMISQLTSRMEQIGLKWNTSKLKCMYNKYCVEQAGVWVAGNKVNIYKSLVVVGSLVNADSAELETFKHRCTQCWKSFHKWKHILCCHTSMEARVKFWCKTVGTSLTWCLETTRPNKAAEEFCQHVQRLQFVAMLGIKRRSHTGILEPWLDYHIRRFRAAKQTIEDHKADIRHILKAKRLSYAGHVARFGLGDRETHLIKNLLCFRSLAWWRLQQRAIDNGSSDFRHPGVFSARRWEAQFPRNWMNKLSIDEPM